MRSRSPLGVAPRWLPRALIALIAIVPRLWLSISTVYLFDEDHYWVPLAKSISLSPDAWNTPIRENSHPALSAYGVALGRAVFGGSEFGSRILGVILGVLTILIIVDLTKRWASTQAAVVAGLLLALNEYHVQISVLAIEKVYYLFFSAFAVWAFVRFLLEERSGWLYVAASATALSYWSKELAVLLLPAFVITLALSRRSWLRRREPYVAAAIFLALIAPDIVWNMAQSSGDPRIDLSESLSRIKGLGVSYEPWAFYARTVVDSITTRLGHPFQDAVPEYAVQNLAFAAILLTGVGATMCESTRRRDPVAVFLLLVFWVLILFFTFLDTEEADTGLDDFAFHWIDQTLFAAVVLGAAWFSRLRGAGRAIGFTVLGAACVMSLTAIFRHRLRMPDAQMSSTPASVVAGGNAAQPVQIAVNTCEICDQKPRVRLKMAEAWQGEIRIPDAEIATSIEGARLGDDVRTVTLSASQALADKYTTYQFTFGISQNGRPEQDVFLVVLLQQPTERRRPTAQW